MAAPFVALLAMLQFDSVPARRPVMAIGQTIAINTFVNRVDDVIATMYQGAIGFTFR
jgi:hypothetical protein